MESLTDYNTVCPEFAMFPRKNKVGQSPSEFAALDSAFLIPLPEDSDDGLQMIYEPIKSEAMNTTVVIAEPVVTMANDKPLKSTTTAPEASQSGTVPLLLPTAPVVAIQQPQSEYDFGRSGIIPTLVFSRRKNSSSNSYSTRGNWKSNKMTFQNRQNRYSYNKPTDRNNVTAPAPTNITDIVLNCLLSKNDERVVTDALTVEAQQLSDVPSLLTFKDEIILTSSKSIDPVSPAVKIPAEEETLTAKSKKKRKFAKQLLNLIKIKVDEYERANGKIILPPHYDI